MDTCEPPSSLSQCVCVCDTVLSVYQRESGYLHMAESKYLVKMGNVIDG